MHGRQYRRGGLFNLAKLALEHLGAYGSNPYDRPGTLENEAHSAAKDGAPIPWELQCSTCDKFY